MNDGGSENYACVLYLFFLLHLQASTAHDAQCHQNYTTLNQVWRSTAYEIKAREKPRCDRNYIVDDIWYRFESSVGNKMPTANPGFRKCGTFIPLWLKGVHPTADQGVIDAVACAVVPRQGFQGCGDSYNIKIVNCSGFYLYRLKRPQQCSLAYCAGKPSS